MDWGGKAKFAVDISGAHKVGLQQSKREDPQATLDMDMRCVARAKDSLLWEQAIASNAEINDRAERRPTQTLPSHPCSTPWKRR